MTRTPTQVEPNPNYSRDLGKARRIITRQLEAGLEKVFPGATIEFTEVKPRDFYNPVEKPDEYFAIELKNVSVDEARSKFGTLVTHLPHGLASEKVSGKPSMIGGTKNTQIIGNAAKIAEALNALGAEVPPLPNFPEAMTAVAGRER